MPRFYSSQWVAAFNEAVADLDPAGADTGGSVVAGDGRFSVTQVIADAPDAAGGPDLVTTLSVADGQVTMALGEPPAGSADVTIGLSWADASALSRGELDSAGALAGGRVRVRGDLAALVAAQSLLASAASRLAALQADTTY